MTRARLRFTQGDPIELELSEIVDFGPPVSGFRAWLGAVYASTAGRWVIRLGDDDEILGFRRDELRRVRLTPTGADITLGDGQEVTLREADVRSYGPEPEDVRSWLGRLAHGDGEAYVWLRDGKELRFAIGKDHGPHVAFLEPRARPSL